MQRKTRNNLAATTDRCGKSDPLLCLLRRNSQPQKLLYFAPCETAFRQVQHHFSICLLASSVFYPLAGAFHVCTAFHYASAFHGQVAERAHLAGTAAVTLGMHFTIAQQLLVETAQNKGVDIAASTYNNNLAKRNALEVLSHKNRHQGPLQLFFPYLSCVFLTLINFFTVLKEKWAAEERSS